MNQTQQEQMNRNVMVYGDITTDKVENIVSHIAAINDYDFDMDSQVKNYEPEPIKLFICSPGGELLPTLGLCSYIMNSMTPVATVCMGEACSAAFLILICGHVRYAVPGSSMMAHQAVGGQFGSAKDCEIALKQMQRLETYMLDIVKKKTKIPESLITDIYHSQTDRYLSVEEAKEFGVIDHIYGELCEDEDDEGLTLDENEEVDLDDDEPASLK